MFLSFYWLSPVSYDEERWRIVYVRLLPECWQLCIRSISEESFIRN